METGKQDFLITVVTVVRNGAHRIGQTIDSVTRQAYTSLQYVVVDGKSNDGTLDLLKKRATEIDILISEPDNGISDAFNKGIDIAKGEVVGILNAGDRYEPHTLAEVAQAFQAHPDVDVVCGAIQFWEAGSRPLLCKSDPSRLENVTSVYHPTVFIRRSTYLKLGLFDERYRYAMDYELLLRYKIQGAKFLCLESKLADMSLDGTSYEHWYAGLKEVRLARSMYFSFSDVWFRHCLAVTMNLLARVLKNVGLRSFYEAYWLFRNRQTSIRSNVMH